MSFTAAGAQGDCDVRLIRKSRRRRKTIICFMFMVFVRGMSRMKARASDMLLSCQKKYLEPARILIPSVCE
jgi:hypothetical protein